QVYHERGRDIQLLISGMVILELGLTFVQGLSELFVLTLFTLFHGLPPRIVVEDGVCSVDAPRRDVARSARTSLTPLGEDRGDPLAGVAVPQWRDGLHGPLTNMAVQGFGDGLEEVGLGDELVGSVRDGHGPFCVGP